MSQAGERAYQVGCCCSLGSGWVSAGQKVTQGEWQPAPKLHPNLPNLLVLPGMFLILPHPHLDSSPGPCLESTQTP